uniref:Uncharacterized protein n=1 Tax=Plectus sambesii TaxID=2011161 RepID=A0A914WQ76_9BILA
MAVVSPTASREKRMSRAFSTVDSQNAVLHQEEVQKCCFDRSNIKHGLYLFLFLDCAMAVVLFTTVIIHVAIQNNHSLIYILFTTVFCIGTALSVTFTWLSLRTEKAVFLWVFIGSTIATITFTIGLGIMLLLENVLLIQTKVFKNSIFGFDDATLS